MDLEHDTFSTPAPNWRSRWSQLRARIRVAAPFMAGVLAALLGLLLFRWFFPPSPPLSVEEVNQAVAQAMASATPAPAYSAQVYQVIQPSLVLIQSRGVRHGQGRASGLGSGVVISDQGDILTALHVVEDAQEIRLTFADGSETSAQVTATQPEHDIAVLHADQLPPLLIPAVLGNPNAMQVGDEAYAVGNPFGLYSSMSAGVISGFNRSFEAEDDGQRIDGLMQIDASVNPGNSGGPLLNRAGQVVGIVVGILNPTDDEFFVGIGFAVPITIAGGAAGAPPY
jgi:S1-C subfamily serine protease